MNPERVKTEGLLIETGTFNPHVFVFMWDFVKNLFIKLAMSSRSPPAVPLPHTVGTSDLHHM